VTNDIVMNVMETAMILDPSLASGFTPGSIGVEYCDILLANSSFGLRILNQLMDKVCGNAKSMMSENGIQSWAMGILVMCFPRFESSQSWVSCLFAGEGIRQTSFVPQH
jgi:hypothetical protein